MGRDSLANRLAVKRKAGFLKSFGKRIDFLRRERERLARAMADPDILGDKPWIEQVERTVQGFIGAGPVYGITAVSDWAKRSLERIKSIKQAGTPPTEDDVNWITSITQELVVLHSEALGDIQDDLSPEELEANPLRVSMLPLGAFPSAKRLRNTMPPTAATEKPTEASHETPDGSHTLPTKSADAAELQDRDSSRDDEIVPAHVPSNQPLADSVSGYGTSPGSDGSEPAVEATVAVEASGSENVEKTIPLTVEDLTQVRGIAPRDQAAPLVSPLVSAEKSFRGWKLLALGLSVALLVSLYYNWKGYASKTDARPESITDTEITSAESTTAFSSSAEEGPNAKNLPPADTEENPTAESPPPADVKEPPEKTEATASTAPKKVEKKKKPRSRSRSRAKAKSRRSGKSTTRDGSGDSVSPTPSKNTGVLSILAPPGKRGPVAITVDKRARGNAPVKLQLSPGLHEVIQTYEGRRIIRIILIQEGKTKTITAKVPQ